MPAQNGIYQSIHCNRCIHAQRNYIKTIFQFGSHFYAIKQHAYYATKRIYDDVSSVTTAKASKQLQ